MRVKLLVFTFYWNGGLHAVSIGKLCELMLNFWMVRFVKTKYELNFGFLHIPTDYVRLSSNISYLLILGSASNYYAPSPVGEVGALGGHRHLLSVRPSV